MEVKFIATTSAKLSELSIVSGQLIYLSDLNATYYDMGTSRRLMSSMRLMPALPSTSIAQEGVLYGVVNAAGNIEASVWDASASTYRCLSGYKATTTSLGLVQPDGTTITVDANGVISCHAEVTSLPATSITYDNSVSGLTATNAQLAFDEIKSLTDDAAASASTAITIANGASTAAAAAEQAATNASTAAAAASAAASQAAGQVSQFESRISALESQASTVASRISGLESTVSSYGSTFSSVETRLAAVEAVAAIALTTEGSA